MPGAKWPSSCTCCSDEESESESGPEPICELVLDSSGGNDGFCQDYPITPDDWGQGISIDFNPRNIPDRLILIFDPTGPCVTEPGGTKIDADASIGTDTPAIDTGCVSNNPAGYPGATLTDSPYIASIPAGTTQARIIVEPNCDDDSASTAWVFTTECIPCFEPDDTVEGNRRYLLATYTVLNGINATHPQITMACSNVLAERDEVMWYLGAYAFASGLPVLTPQSGQPPLVDVPPPSQCETAGSDCVAYRGSDIAQYLCDNELSQALIRLRMPGTLVPSSVTDSACTTPTFPFDVRIELDWYADDGFTDFIETAATVDLTVTQANCRFFSTSPNSGWRGFEAVVEATVLSTGDVDVTSASVLT